jgi:hypothetical protein
VGRLLVAYVLATSAVAMADSRPFALTATQQRHELPIVAVAPNAWLVAWQETAPSGADDRPWRLTAAIVDDSGKTLVAAKMLAEGSRVDELHAIWNGKTFTIAACEGSFGNNPKIAWGELALDGTYTRRGEQVIAGHVNAFSCAMAREGDKAVVIATSRAERRGGHEQVLWRTCKTRRVTLDADKAIVGKENRVCQVWAADASWILGPDAKDHPLLVDAAGKSVALALDAQGAAASGGELVAKTPSAKGDGLEARWLVPPNKQPARVVALAGGPFQPRQDVEVLALRDDALALVGAAVGADRMAVAIFRPDGKLAWSGGLGGKDAEYWSCAARATDILCAWTDDVHDRGEVRAERIQVPQ